MYKNDVGKGGVCDHEAYEAKKIKYKILLCEYIAPTSFLYKYILLSGVLKNSYYIYIYDVLKNSNSSGGCDI
jgi:hypothetical protein